MISLVQQREDLLDAINIIRDCRIELSIDPDLKPAWAFMRDVGDYLTKQYKTLGDRPTVEEILRDPEAGIMGFFRKLDRMLFSKGEEGSFE